MEKSIKVKLIREQLGITQSEFALRLGTDQASIAKHENGKRPIGKNFEYKLLNEFRINQNWWDKDEGEIFAGNAKMSTNDFVDLEYIPVKARAGFAELQHIVNEPTATYRVSRFDPDETFLHQVIIEIDGDSMEPNYSPGTKVRCKEIDRGDWQYMNSGVYAVVYSNFFVVKRIKNSPKEGVLTLHSDNTETGGITDVRLSDVRKIWKVLRIVDAPAR